MKIKMKAYDQDKNESFHLAISEAVRVERSARKLLTQAEGKRVALNG